MCITKKRLTFLVKNSEKLTAGDSVLTTYKCQLKLQKTPLNQNNDYLKMP